jgi:alkaline phosphatase D
MVAVWDDHDVGMNDGGATNPHKEVAKEIAADFYDWESTDPRMNRDGVYVSYAFGPAGAKVQVILLDTRWFRSDLVHSPDGKGYAGSNDSQATMLGATQWSWLEEKLSEPADVRLVVTTIQFIAVGHPWERWAAFPLEQTRFYHTVAAAQRRGGGNGVVLLSGDRHVGGVYKQEPGPTPHSVNNTIGYPLWEFTSSSLTHTMFGTIGGETCPQGGGGADTVAGCDEAGL